MSNDRNKYIENKADLVKAEVKAINFQLLLNFLSHIHLAKDYIAAKSPASLRSYQSMYV